MSAFEIRQAEGATCPIIVSVPHCGTRFPDDIRNDFRGDLVKAPDDTDWFVDQLYDFAPSMGITMISAVWSRWVIDLNRDRDSKPLYNDGRIITALCPTVTFLGEAIYNDGRKEVSSDEVDRRIGKYYSPYHNMIQELLDSTRRKFGCVLLWDCHSIRQVVPTIQPQKFPDLILGSADERSASKPIIDIALRDLSSSTFGLSHNHPFKGGTITRTFGRPETHQHALQLEMPKVNYMDDTETLYDAARAAKVREVLKRTLSNLSEYLVRTPSHG